MLQFKEWFHTLTEMSARRSFSRTLSKFRSDMNLQKPLAILTAFRGDIDPDQRQQLRKNRIANEILKKQLASRGLSSYPVMGVGQEDDRETGQVNTTNEESFIVQPIGNMPENEFLRHLKELLFSGQRQWGAAVKLPSNPNAFLLHHSGDVNNPEDYNQTTNLGTSAKIANPSDPYQTKMVNKNRGFVIGDDHE